MKRVAAIKLYFGLLPGQTISQFATELKALSEESKDELAAGAAKALGVEIVA